MESYEIMDKDGVIAVTCDKDQAFKILSAMEIYDGFIRNQYGDIWTLRPTLTAAHS